MEVQSFDIKGLKLLKPRVFGDERGYFLESYSKAKYDEALGEPVNFIQDNESSSSKGVFRGLHFQKPPHDQAKLVRVIEGSVLDVAVDMRTNSPTYGKYQIAELTGSNKYQFFVPRGFAHGFLVLSESAIFSYKVDNIYAPESDSGIRFDDPTIGIDWGVPLEDIQLSPKDAILKSFADYMKNPCF